MPWGLPKEYDLFYSCQGGDWNDYARNWTLAKASIKRLVTELNIKACHCEAERPWNLLTGHGCAMYVGSSYPIYY